MSTVKPIYVIDDSVQRLISFDGMSLRHLLTSIENYKKNSSNSSSQYSANPVDFGGIEALQWVGCLNNTGKPNITLQVMSYFYRYSFSVPVSKLVVRHFQIEVIHTGRASVLKPYSSTLKNPYLLSIRILIFNSNTFLFFSLN